MRPKYKFSHRSDNGRFYHFVSDREIGDQVVRFEHAIEIHFFWRGGKK